MGFFVLLDQGQPPAAADCQVEPVEPYRLEPSTRTCSRCGAALEPARWAAPHLATVTGSNCWDLLPGAGFELVISETAWADLRACEVTGLRCAGTLDASALGQTYLVVRPHVSMTKLDEAASNLVWRRPPTCDQCRLGVRERLGPIVFDPATLDGSDIFVPSGAYGLKVVTQKFVDCVEAHELKGFYFVAAESYYE